MQDVTKQCTKDNLIPSLLFNDIQFLKSHINTSSLSSNTAQIENIIEGTARVTLYPDIRTKSHSKDNLPQQSNIDSVDEKALLIGEIESSQEKILELQNEIKLAEQQLQQVNHTRSTFIWHVGIIT